MVPNFKLYFLIIYLFPLFLAAQTGETRASIFETAHYVTNDKSAVQMVRFDAIYFESDSISVQQKYWSSLDYLIHWLKSNSDTQIELHGHTNGIPSYNYCKNLGKKRAEAVKEYLVKKGIPSAQIICKSQGKSKQLVKSNAKKIKHWNQRVEIKIGRAHV